MSDTVRNWSSTTGAPKRKPRRRGFFRWIILALIPLVFIWTWYVSRDTHTTASLVPRDQAYEIYLNNPLQQRLRLAQSNLWRLLPPGIQVDDLRAQLASDIGVPEWVLNNLVPGACLVTGNEIESFDDALFISRMTRVGCLIEKGRGLVSEVSVDPAGGLNLCYVADADIWYAVRGRVLLATRSRNALIHALTLSENDAQSVDALRAGYARAREALVFARLNWTESETGPGAWLTQAEGTLHLAPEGGEIRCTLLPAPDLRTRLAPVLADARPTAIPPALSGLVSISADFGQPLGTLWPTLESVAGAPGFLEESLAVFGEDATALQTLAKTILAPAGPGVRVAWLGVDTLEMLPTPELVVTASGGSAALRDQFAAMPAPPPGSTVETPWPRFDEDHQFVTVPMAGGPSIEPTFAIWDDGLLLSSSRTRAETLQNTSPPQQSPGQGNLYIRANPTPIVDAVAATGREFAVIGALRGQTLKSFDAAVAPWRTWAQFVDRISLLAAHTGNGSLDATLSVRLAGQQ